jgi:hypothetical protein
LFVINHACFPFEFAATPWRSIAILMAPVVAVPATCRNGRCPAIPGGQDRQTVAIDRIALEKMTLERFQLHPIASHRPSGMQRLSQDRIAEVDTLTIS